MSYLKFDKEQLVNLEYSLNKEILRSNRAGTYTSTTLNGCNTRKYHGLLVTPIKEFGGEKHVLLSTLDPTVVQHGSAFNLGIHRYKGGHYEPKGHKYIRDIEFEKVPVITYRVGGVVLSIERLLVEQAQQLLIKYTLKEAHSPTILQLRPFLAFRGIHNLSKANLFLNRKFIPVKNGIKLSLYDGYPFLHMQLGKRCEFVPVPDWYYNVEYIKEMERGYEYLEDLYVPGYFEFSIKKGESVIFSASTEETDSKVLSNLFSEELGKREDRNSIQGFLKNASEQFILKKDHETDIIAGFPWYGSFTRQALIALPGLAASLEDDNLFGNVLRTYLKYFKDGLLPKSIEEVNPSYDSTDLPLWFFWALQKWYLKSGRGKELWKEFGPAMKSMLARIRNGLSFNNKMLGNGLVYAGKEKTALTWMDSSVDGIPVVQRKGLVVEINALWYNTVCFATELAEKANDHFFLTEWEGLREKIRDSFQKTFWNEDAGYLADYVDDGYTDMVVRPSMVIATALVYSPLTRAQKKSVLSICRDQLLTPRGLRTLSPDNPKYKGVVEGNPAERELAVHQGAVGPWLISFFVDGYLKVHQRGGVPFVKKVVEGFEEALNEHGIGTLSEIYDGNPPHAGRGAISQAWSVASVAEAFKIIQKFENG